MSFFEKQDTQGGAGSFELGGGSLQPIPDGTRVLAICEEAKNETYDFKSYIKLKWRISQPEQHANRVIFQKLQVYDDAKSAAHRKMLAAIATNAGGKLFSAMESAGEDSPSDQSLQHLCNRPMVLLLGVWELEDKGKSGNWVKAVSPRKDGAQAAAPINPATAKPAKPAPAPVSVDDDDIPF